MRSNSLYDKMMLPDKVAPTPSEIAPQGVTNRKFLFLHKIYSKFKMLGPVTDVFDFPLRTPDAEGWYQLTDAEAEEINNVVFKTT